MTSVTPFEAVWTGEAFEPLRRHHNEIAAAYAEGEVVWLAEHQPRSMRSHGHYFACVEEAWKNLPEAMAGRWPTPDHLRRWAPIKAGICDQRSVVVASKAEAQRLAAFMRPLDEYAVVDASEAVVTVYTAKSQSLKAMGREAFQASKDAVLSVLADVLEVSTEALSKTAREAA